MGSKWKSRKFWMAIVGNVVGIVALACGATVAGNVEAIAGAVIMVLSTLGYLTAEASVDRAKIMSGKK